MSVKKPLIYLADASITLRNDHLPSIRFLEKTALNAKVNNWDVELSDYYIKFKFMKGVRNKLADTLSRLIDLNLTELNSPEMEGHNYGYATFELLPDINVSGSKFSPTLCNCC